ncbi:hypothetical protein TNCV_4643191 [Trichonephila clavipes]|nr:hypothetical protein TNCV_4643191 [Trichonephila clavipes]
MVLKTKANDRRHFAPCHDEFCRSRSGLCRSGGISNNNKSFKVKFERSSLLAMWLLAGVSFRNPVPLKTRFDSKSSGWRGVVFWRGGSTVQVF